MDSPPTDDTKHTADPLITEITHEEEISDNHSMKHTQETVNKAIPVIDYYENEVYSKEIPKYMRGIQLVKYGNLAESLQYSESIPVPKLDHKKSQILVQVKAAGVNPIDVKVASGNIKFATYALSLPTVIGADFAGFVVDKTDKVVDFDVGDHVCGTQRFPFTSHGTHAEYTLVDIHDATVAKKPKVIPFETAAAAGVAVIAAYKGIIEQGSIDDANKQEKRSIIIVGASGGVGNYALQLSRLINRDNTVIAICSAKNADINLSFGATKTIDYNNKEEFEEFVKASEHQEAFDIILDCVGSNEYFDKLSRLLKKKDGVYCSTVGLLEYFGSHGKFSFSAALRLLCKIGYRSMTLNGRYTVLNTLTGNSSDILKRKILPIIENKRLIAPIVTGHSTKIVAPIISNNSIIPLKYAHEAYKKILTNHTYGKIILTID
ncbi:hypothetical protein INT47_001899 [Mucor saturninus]|uniref:Enoyl reductase (ER) domain-containing protein n=1 Tax=Mucor saturninus TaxID=64648 RepID=A0A8H7V4E7_9FUNG|nr:hypothetical protein INT47_001899 [Mucor saturninus]